MTKSRLSSARTLATVVAVLGSVVGCSGSDSSRSPQSGGGSGGGSGSTSGGSSSGGGSGTSSGGSGTGSSGTSSGSSSGGSSTGSGGLQDARAPDGSSAESGVDGDGGSSAILVPARGALLGHFYGNGTLAQTDALIGRKPLLHLNYFDWVTDWTADPRLPADFADGRVPIVNWEPYDGSGGMISFDDIVSGKYDSEIQARAINAKSFGNKFFLDFAAEMNGDEAWTNHDAAKYIAGWRHLHDIFTTAGATNVIWAWCPNVTDSDNTNSATLSYYPGDSYVDWTGVDGYNWGTSQPDFGWQSFQQVFQSIYPLLASLGKPILIGEMASDEVGGSKAQWIDDIVPTLRTSFPMIRAFVWFDIKKERDWEIHSSPSALASYSRMALDPFMNP